MYKGADFVPWICKHSLGFRIRLPDAYAGRGIPVTTDLETTRKRAKDLHKLWHAGGKRAPKSWWLRWRPVFTLAALDDGMWSRAIDGARRELGETVLAHWARSL